MSVTPIPVSLQDLTSALTQVREVVAVVGSRPRQDRPLFRKLQKLGLSAAMAVATMTGGQAVMEPLVVAAGAVGLSLGSSPAEAVSRSTESAFRQLYPGTSWAPEVVTIEPPLPPAEQHWQTLALGAPSEWEALPAYLHTQEEPFLALAAVMEHFVPDPYTDPGGLNVGYGYCITRRIQDWGPERVRSDLTDAGFAAPDVERLMEGAKAAKGVKVEPLQALRLLWATQGDYRDIARNSIGEKVFDGLPKHQQATLTWLAYNTGEEGFGQFKKLSKAVQAGDTAEASRHLMPYFVQDGEFTANRRAGALLMTSYWSPEGFEAVATNSATVLEVAQSGTSPIHWLDAKAKQAPPSPYINLALAIQARQSTQAPLPTVSPSLSRPRSP